MKAKELIQNIVAIFVIAPLEVLESRIRRRDKVSDDYVLERMNYTRMAKYTNIYDYKIDNVEGS